MQRRPVPLQIEALVIESHLGEKMKPHGQGLVLAAGIPALQIQTALGLMQITLGLQADLQVLRRLQGEQFFRQPVQHQVRGPGRFFQYIGGRGGEPGTYIARKLLPQHQLVQAALDFSPARNPGHILHQQFPVQGDIQRIGAPGLQLPLCIQIHQLRKLDHQAGQVQAGCRPVRPQPGKIHHQGPGIRGRGKGQGADLHQVRPNLQG